MGREVRRVPADWQHPTDEDGEYIPLFDGFLVKDAKWLHDAQKWAEGLCPCPYHDGEFRPKTPDLSYSYEEYAGPRPVASEYMPDWPQSERTHFQRYENTTEGTPISPIFADAESLARWVADTDLDQYLLSRIV